MRKVLAIISIGVLPFKSINAQTIEEGKFLRHYWYENGLEHGNPNFNRSVRVNAPEISLHPVFGKRVEVKGNGMMQIRIDQPLDQIKSASLYLELWGGHPETTDKKVTVNGRSTYDLPEVGTAEGHCTYHYPQIPVKITDLVNGYNVFQFSCAQGNSFWGHFLIDNARLTLELKDDYKAIPGVNTFQATVKTGTATTDSKKISLEVEGLNPSEIEKVVYYGWYEAYDDNGNGLERDWHGYTKKRLPQNVLGESGASPFDIVWNTSMLKPQNNVRIKAEVYFKNQPGISFVTPEKGGENIPVRPSSRVDRFRSHDVPVPFWSRAGRLNVCTIVADVLPEKIEKAELHVLIWDGGEGSVKEHFKWNGTPLPLASGKHAHDVIYRIFELDPSTIRMGENTIELLSDTEHHGIEILLPGPELVIRSAR